MNPKNSNPDFTGERHIFHYTFLFDAYEVSDCVDKICAYYKETWKLELSEEEKLYLILHVNRVCSREENND